MRPGADRLLDQRGEAVGEPGHHPPARAGHDPQRAREPGPAKAGGGVAEGREDRMPRVDRRQRRREGAVVGRLDAQAGVADDLAERAGVERVAGEQPQRAAASGVVVQDAARLARQAARAADDDDLAGPRRFRAERAAGVAAQHLDGEAAIRPARFDRRAQQEEIVAVGLLAEQRDRGERRRVEHEIARVVGRDAVGIGDAMRATPLEGSRAGSRTDAVRPGSIATAASATDRSLTASTTCVLRARMPSLVTSATSASASRRAGPTARFSTGPPTSTTSSVRPSAIAPAACSTSRSLIRTSRPLAAPARRVAALHSGVSAVPPLPAVERGEGGARRAAIQARLGEHHGPIVDADEREPIAGGRGGDGPQRGVLRLGHPARRAHAERRVHRDDGDPADGVLAAEVRPGEGRAPAAPARATRSASSSRSRSWRGRRASTGARRRKRIAANGCAGAVSCRRRCSSTGSGHGERPSRNSGERKASPITCVAIAGRGPAGRRAARRRAARRRRARW